MGSLEPVSSTRRSPSRPAQPQETYRLPRAAHDVRTKPRTRRRVGGDLPTWTVVGWVFFNAHAVSTRLPGLLGPESVDLLSQVDAFPTFLYAVPPLALLGAGAVVGTLAADRQGAGVGVAAVVVGYLVFVATATVAVSVPVGETTVGPASLPALALAGVCCPLVFGGLGVVAGRQVSS